MTEISFVDGPVGGMTVEYESPTRTLFVRRINRIENHKPLACPACGSQCLHAYEKWTFAATAWPDEHVDDRAGIRAVIDRWPSDYPAHVYSLKESVLGTLLYEYVEEASSPRATYTHAPECLCSGCVEYRQQLIDGVVDHMVGLASEVGEGGEIPSVPQLADKYRLREEDATSVHSFLRLGGVAADGIVLPQEFWRGTILASPPGGSQSRGPRQGGGHPGGKPVTGCVERLA